MDDPVVAFDFGRMFLGNEPPLFLLEIAIRTVIIYVYTLVLIRWIGSRSIAQLSLVEFLLVIALGSAVGDAMFYPEVPLVHCMVVITIVVLLDKTLSFVVSRNSALEDVIEGKSVEIVRDGVISCQALESLNYGHDELFEQLRLKEVEHLGQVRAAYLETNGSLSVFKETGHPGRAGLSIDPPWDVQQPRQWKTGTIVKIGAGGMACARCGKMNAIFADEVLPACENCKGDIWHETSVFRAGASSLQSDAR